jgi:prepilin-type N-terminal cleavage/methylation domain-containing protein
VRIGPRKGAFAGPPGFTLVEVLAALIVMGVAFAVLAQGLMSASRASSVSQAYTRATAVAVGKMAEVEAGAYALSANVTERIEEDIYNFDVDVTPIPASRQGLQEVTVEVKWRMHGREHQVKLVRFVHEALRKKE